MLALSLTKGYMFRVICFFCYNIIMEKNLQKQNHILTIALIVLALIIVGGTVYLWQQTKISRLQNQLAQNLPLSPSPNQEINLPTIIPTNKPTTQPAETIPSPTTQTRSDVVLIQEAFAEKYSKPVSDTNVTINKNTGTHASGSIKFSGEMGGGMWFAYTDSEGNWQIAFDGNGTPTCSQIEPHNFPSSIINECYDEDLGIMKPL